MCSESYHVITEEMNEYVVVNVFRAFHIRIENVV